MYEALNTGSREDVKKEWVRWIGGLDEIEDGMVCAVARDWSLMNNYLPRLSWEDIRGRGIT